MGLRWLIDRLVTRPPEVQVDSYELRGIDGNYNKVVLALSLEATIHSQTGNTDQFYMPDRTTLKLRRYPDKTCLSVIRTTRSMPRYVTELLESLDGE